MCRPTVQVPHHVALEDDGGLLRIRDAEGSTVFRVESGESVTVSDAGPMLPWDTNEEQYDERGTFQVESIAREQATGNHWIPDAIVLRIGGMVGLGKTIVISDESGRQQTFWHLGSGRYVPWPVNRYEHALEQT